MFRLRNFLNKIFPKETIKSLIIVEVIVGIILSVFSLLFFVFITSAVLQKQTIVVDKLLSNYIYSLRTPLLTKTMLFASFLGEQLVIAGSVLVIIFLTRRHHRKETFIFPLLLVMGIVSTTILKIIFKVPRPTIDPLVSLDTYSFPSGHALNAFLFYATIAYFVYHFTKRKLTTALVAIAALTVILLVGLSRVYLGVHHPSDVLAGYDVGFSLFVTTIVVDKTIDYFRLIRENTVIEA